MKSALALVFIAGVLALNPGIVRGIYNAATGPIKSLKDGEVKSSIPVINPDKLRKVLPGTEKKAPERKGAGGKERPGGGANRPGKRAGEQDGREPFGARAVGVQRAAGL